MSDEIMDYVWIDFERVADALRQSIHRDAWVRSVQRELLRGTTPSRWWLRGEPWYEDGAYEPCYPGVSP